MLVFHKWTSSDSLAALLIQLSVNEPGKAVKIVQVLGSLHFQGELDDAFGYSLA